MTHLEDYIMEQVQNIWDKLPPLPSGWAYDLNFDYHFNHETRAYEVTTRPTLRKVCADSDYSGLNDFERAVHRGFLCAGVKNVPVDLIKETAKDFLAQLLKEAAEGRIGACGLHNAIFFKDQKLNDMLDKYEEGDKVRVIVLPMEDEKCARNFTRLFRRTSPSGWSKRSTWAGRWRRNTHRTCWTSSTSP